MWSDLYMSEYFMNSNKTFLQFSTCFKTSRLLLKQFENSYVSVVDFRNFFWDSKSFKWKTSHCHNLKARVQIGKKIRTDRLTLRYPFKTSCRDALTRLISGNQIYPILTWYFNSFHLIPISRKTKENAKKNLREIDESDIFLQDGFQE